MMGYGYGMMGFGWMWIMMILPVVLIGLIVYAAVKLANGGAKRYGGNYNESSHAIEILKQKFANGEISEEEYKRKKDLLRE